MSGLRVEGLTYAYPKASENILDQVSFWQNAESLPP